MITKQMHKYTLQHYIIGFMFVLVCLKQDFSLSSVHTLRTGMKCINIIREHTRVWFMVFT